jgi:hypothetical protein
MELQGVRLRSATPSLAIALLPSHGLKRLSRTRRGARQGRRLRKSRSAILYCEETTVTARLASPSALPSELNASAELRRAPIAVRRYSFE